ncbi:chemotaxis protein CheC, inhibitor of MCP methylation [Candidatus Methanoperedens nitroreducens]|uniref:Chemotaxis protein CheC, inhibitor of MCP methylation n=1 Tax=Candidatus Methanoperedens nitratireducens TaxID=1392998 RepID=A0A062UVS5_9EURY|nr:chemotaxis protein CheC [Candidatus Methanoperedens nitroreducens]KCZ71126.1 chemotaxis protein CheC, inhibitor of MCP methylation [Candidatus Methanoperedens nitroreducens]MDJ1421496.1 chemotaxis protein CheC [Candidatus Methanoperedens sp.]
MDEIKTLTDFQYDALKEVGNIGMGQASTSLSKMMNQPVNISLPYLKLVPLLQLPQLVKNQNPVVGIIQELNGDERGFLLLLLSKESAKHMIKLMLGSAGETDAFDEMEESVLNEMSNIMNGTYISALSNFLGISIGLSIPFQVYDMSDAIVNQIIGLMMHQVNYVLLLKTEFKISSEKIDGAVLIFTDSMSLSIMLDAINRLLGR